MPDPFATQEKTPSVSFKDKPIGTRVSGRVVEAPEEVQSRDYDTGEPAFWPDGKPKKSIVTVLEINGERYGLWAPKPSAMFRALSDAQQVAGAQIAVGGILTVDFTGEQPNPDKPRLNPQKQYKAFYQPNNPFGEDSGNGQQVNTQTGEVTQAPQQPPYAQPQTPQQPTPQQGQLDVATITRSLQEAGITDPATIAAIIAARQQG